jgi:biopolymer transport protein ExbD
MGRRSLKNKPEIELFPFLSVLACTIGSLILLIIVISTQTLDSNPEVTILAQTEVGQNRKKQPRYLECTKDGVIIYPTQEFVAKNDLKNKDSKLLNFISEVKKNNKREYVILAIRPQGIEVFHEVRSLIEKEKIDLGYEPIEEGWTLKILE